MTPAELAAALQVSAATVNRWVAIGCLWPVGKTPSGKPRFSAEQRDRLVAEREKLPNGRRYKPHDVPPLPPEELKQWRRREAYQFVQRTIFIRKLRRAR